MTHRRLYSTATAPGTVFAAGTRSLAIAAALGIAACGPDAASDPPVPTWILAPALTIGGDDEGPASFQISAA